MKKRTLGVVAALGLVVALVVGSVGVALAFGRGPGAMLGGVAQGYGPGPGYGSGPNTGSANRPGPDYGQRVGPGAGYGYGPGSMMGGYGYGSSSSGGYGYGPGGMMGGYGFGQGSSSSYGYGPGGMMGSGWSQGNTNGQPISMDQAQQDVQNYIDQTGNKDLVIDEVMEFQDNFYAIVKEKSTGIGAFEVLVNKYNGAVMPEPGPNHMWNTKYGIMASNSWMGQAAGYQQPTGPMTVTSDQAAKIAQQWLDQNQPGSTTEKPDQFYGYYTVHTLKDGKVTGMLSVDGYTGQVWYHTWHGAFIQMKDLGA